MRFPGKPTSSRTDTDAVSTTPPRRRARSVTAGITLAVAVLGLSAMGATTASAAPAKAPAVLADLDIGLPALQVPPSSRFIPPLVRGDREFNGHGPDVTVNARLLAFSQSIDVSLFMNAVETRSDWTTASGSRSYRIYTAPPGMCIQSVNIGTFDSLQYRDTDHAVDVFSGQDPFSFVGRYEAVGDTSGDDAGVSTGVTIFTRPFTAHLVSC